MLKNKNPYLSPKTVKIGPKRDKFFSTENA